MIKQKIPIGLDTLKSKVDKLDVDKLVPAHTDLNKLSYVAKIMLWNRPKMKTDYDA